MSEKVELDFSAFLMSLTLPPLSLKNKELAAMLRVQDAVVSKARHGRFRVLPEQLRPFGTIEHFTNALVSHILSSISEESVADYARDLKKTFRLSERLTQLCDEVCDVLAEGKNTGQRVSLTSETFIGFFSLCYHESYYNSGMRLKSIKQEKYGRKMEISGGKSKLDVLLKEIEQGAFSREELERLERAMVKAMVPMNAPRESYYGTFYRSFANQLKEQFFKPYYRSAARREEISIYEQEGVYERRIASGEHLILPERVNFPYYIRRTMINFEKRSRRDFIDSLFGEFQGTINGIPLLEHINRQGHTVYQNFHDAVTLTTVPGVSGREPYVRAELVIPLNAMEAGDHFELEISYLSRLSFMEDYSTHYSYRLKYPCQFFSHEHVLSPGTADRWQIMMDVFSAFNYAGNDETSNPVFQRNIRTDHAPERDQSVIFHDWVLPGTGYRRSLHRTRQG